MICTRSIYLLICRLFTLMSTHKVEFAKVACYLVADYVSELQKVTLLPATKVRQHVKNVNDVLAH